MISSLLLIAYISAQVPAIDGPDIRAGSAENASLLHKDWEITKSFLFFWIPSIAMITAGNVLFLEATSHPGPVSAVIFGWPALALYYFGCQVFFPAAIIAAAGETFKNTKQLTKVIFYSVFGIGATLAITIGMPMLIMNILPIHYNENSFGPVLVVTEASYIFAGFSYLGFMLLRNHLDIE